jgi:hypothetical protein
MDGYMEDAFGLLGILLLLPIMLLVIVPWALFFDADSGLLRNRRTGTGHPTSPAQLDQPSNLSTAKGV